MTVPHTRPLVISAHASEPSLVRDYHTWDARLVVPGAAALETEMQLAAAGFDAIGLTALVTHYIAGPEFPDASHALLKAFADLADRQLPLKTLEKYISRVQQQLAQQTEDSHEIATVVGALEQQYDKEVRRLQKKKSSLLEPGQDIPTGEELGAEFEAFLARMNDAADTDSEADGEDTEKPGDSNDPHDDGEGDTQ